MSPTNGTGPPESEGRATQHVDPAVNAEGHPTANTAHDNRADRQAIHDAHRSSHVDDCDWCRCDQPRQVEHVAVQLRRRRLAAHRSPRLHDGRRDPISSSKW